MPSATPSSLGDVVQLLHRSSEMDALLLVQRMHLY